MTHIILVEDDDKLSSLVKKYLQQYEFTVDVIREGNTAVEAILSAQPEVVILDLMLPGKDGLTICREIRSQFNGRILFLTASEDDMDHVAGVELGADDFIIKPIQPRVLLARVRMLLRRTHHIETSAVVSAALSPAVDANNESGVETSIDYGKSAQPIKSLHFGQLSIHHSKRAVTLSEQPVALTTSEFDLLWLLALHAEEVLSRDFLYKTLRGIEYDGIDRSIDTKVAQLRKKLGDNASLSTRIITVRGQGYLFVPDSWDAPA